MDVAKAKRIEQYQRWTGAQPVSDHGVAIKEAGMTAEAAKVIADQEVMQIRNLLKTPVQRVVVSISDEQVIELIKSQLTPEELTKVSFGQD